MNLYTCDAAGHVTSETWYADSTDANAGQNPLDTLNYSYDGAGNLVAESDNASADTYAHDAQNRLTSTTESSQTGPTIVLTYAYTGDSTEPASTSATIDCVADYQNNYQYDSQGNLVSITQTGQRGLSQVSSDETGTVPFDAVADKQVGGQKGGQKGQKGTFYFVSGIRGRPRG